LEIRDNAVLKKYKSVRNRIKNEIRKLQKEEQQNVAQHCKQNPKAFWKYINSKRKTKTGTSDLHFVDIYGNSATISSNIDKAEEFGKFFSSVFTVEQEQSSSSLPVKPCHSPIRELVFNEQTILKKLNKFNISKSPGPDGIHPRVLFELRYELLEALNILFEI